MSKAISHTYNRYYRQIQEAATKPRTRAYTMIVFSLLAISLLGWYAIRPTVQTILYIRKEIEDKTLVNNKMDEKIASLIQAQTDYNSLFSRLPVLVEALPKNPEALAFATQLRNIAHESGVTLSTLRFTNVPLSSDEIFASSSANSPTINSIAISGTLLGPYENLRFFLTGLNNLRRIASVSLLKIDPLGSGSLGATGSGNLLQLTLQLNGYYTGSPVRLYEK